MLGTDLEGCAQHRIDLRLFPRDNSVSECSVVRVRSRAIMLTSYFGIAEDKPPKASSYFGKKPPKPATTTKKTKGIPPPRPSEASTTTTHARFVPLPAERGPVPRPAEQHGRQEWQALEGSGVERDDEFGRLGGDEEDVSEWDEEPHEEEDDDASEPDFEPDSLEDLGDGLDGVGDSLSSSVDDDRRSCRSSLAAGRWLRGKPAAAAGAAGGVPVYSGPQLCCDDSDFDD